MPKINMEFTEDDVQALVANAVREQHKLNKEHKVKTLVVIDRDEEGGNPTVSVHAEWEQPVEVKGKK